MIARLTDLVYLLAATAGAVAAEPATFALALVLLLVLTTRVLTRHARVAAGAVVGQPAAVAPLPVRRTG